MTSSTSQQVTNASSTLQKALAVKTNDELMVIYVSNLVRAIIAFDNLIENKIQNTKLHTALETEADNEKSLSKEKNEQTPSEEPTTTP